MSTPTLTARALAFLRRFRSAPALARECRRRGVRGERGDADACAVAELLHDEFGDRWEVKLEAIPGGCFRKFYGRERRPLPAPVLTFAVAFDAGKYPSLVRGSGS